MNAGDIILSPGYAPSFEEITASISGPAAVLWSDINAHIQSQWKSTPKIMFSRCSGKPGWNVKYQKAGKSLCTLYPESDSFVALVVVTLALVPEILAAEHVFTAYVAELVRTGKPYNGTLWLMIRVGDAAVLGDVKRLLKMKTGLL